MNKLLTEWLNLLIQEWGSDLVIVSEDGNQGTYGEPGTISAYTGPDRQANFVGCFTADLVEIVRRDGSYITHQFGIWCEVK